MCVHPKTKAKLRTKLKELTSRSNGWGYGKRKERLTYAIREVGGIGLSGEESWVVHPFQANTESCQGDVLAELCQQSHPFCIMNLHMLYTGVCVMTHEDGRSGPFP